MIINKHLKCQISHDLISLPPSLLSLIIPPSRANIYLESNVVDLLPPSLTYLELHHSKKSLDHLPKNLLHLHIGYFFGEIQVDYQHMDGFIQPVDHLPPSLSHLTLGGNFNHPVDNLPPSLSYLVIGGLFDHPVDHLPKTLKKLVIVGKQFTYPVDHLAPSLTSLN